MYIYINVVVVDSSSRYYCFLYQYTLIIYAANCSRNKQGNGQVFTRVFTLH